MSSWPKGLHDKAKLDAEAGTGPEPALMTITLFALFTEPQGLSTTGVQASVLVSKVQGQSCSQGPSL